MLIRCSVREQADLFTLDRCQRVGHFFAGLGYRIAYAINRDGHERARNFLGEKATIYRLPEDEDEDIRRMAHLRRTHKHKLIFLHLEQTSSAYLFHLKKGFAYTAVVDSGSRFMIYADLILNPNFDAPSQNCLCAPGARLLLGPKYYLADPQIVCPETQPTRIDRILLHLGEDATRIAPVLTALQSSGFYGTVEVLCAEMGALMVVLSKRAKTWPSLRVIAAVFPTDRAFPWSDYPFIICGATLDCLEMAARGLFFVSLAVEKRQLSQAYILEQLGISPSFGWYASVSHAEMTNKLRDLLADVQQRTHYAQATARTIDTQGLARISRFFPEEK